MIAVVQRFDHEGLCQFLSPDEDLHGRNAILQLLHMFAARMLNNAIDYLSEAVAMSLYGIIYNGAIWLHKYTWMPRREEQQKVVHYPVSGIYNS